LINRSGRRVGRIEDVIVRSTVDGPHRCAPVSGVKAGVGDRQLFVPAPELAQLDHRAARLRPRPGELRSFRRRPGETPFRADVLGRSLINVRAVRLVRSCEIVLEYEDRFWRVAAVDPSLVAPSSATAAAPPPLHVAAARRRGLGRH
jgi:hypothetical protein